MRFAGTWSRYSNSAIPQLTSAATIQGRWLKCRRWAYQAKVMKMLDRTSRTTVLAITGMRDSCGGGGGGGVRLLYHAQDFACGAPPARECPCGRPESRA